MEKGYAQKNEHALEDILARKKTLTYHETITLPLRRFASVGFLAPHVLSRRLYTPPRFTFPLRLFAQWHATLDPQRISSSLWMTHKCQLGFEIGEAFTFEVNRRGSKSTHQVVQKLRCGAYLLPLEQPFCMKEQLGVSS